MDPQELRGRFSGVISVPSLPLLQRPDIGFEGLQRTERLLTPDIGAVIAAAARARCIADASRTGRWSEQQWTS